MVLVAFTNSLVTVASIYISSYFDFNLHTVNSEIFARVLFSRNFAYEKFRENNTLAKWRNHSVVY